jgi:cell division protein FtsW
MKISEESSLKSNSLNPTSNKTKSDSISNWNSYGGNVLWVPVFALTGIGILFVYSASSVYALQTYGNEFYFAKKQALFLIPSFIAGILGAKIPFELFYKYVKWIFLLLVLMTFATHLPHIGRRVGGAPRWLNIGPFPIQPSEFLKSFTLIYMVYLLTSKIKNKRTAKNIYKKYKIQISYLLLILAPIAIISQKDLGTTLVVVSGCLAILFMNGFPKRFFFSIFGFLSFGMLIAILIEPYRISRIMTFLNPFKDPLGSGFQVIQSFIAVANGGIFGKGIGESTQKLFFLPEAHTDFILAVITEEMGFMGILMLSILYSVLYYAILRLVLFAKNHTDRLFASGAFTLLVLTTVINMGVVAGAFPTKGLPLPFISNGGSSLIANFFLIGLLSQISKRIHESQ